MNLTHLITGLTQIIIFLIKRVIPYKRVSKKRSLFSDRFFCGVTFYYLPLFENNPIMAPNFINL